MAKNEWYIIGLKSNLIIRDEFSNPGYILHLTNRRILGLKNVSLSTSLLSPHIYNPHREGELISTISDISEIARNSDFAIPKEDIKKIQIIRPKSGGILKKWTVLGSFSGLGSINIVHKNGNYEKLLFYEKGYQIIKDFFEKYMPSFLEIQE